MSDLDIGDGQAPVGRLDGGGRYQVLALSGGGYRGLYAVGFLAFCEAGFEARSVDRFQMIAGTSVGALLAAGLSCGIPAFDLQTKFEKHGSLIFDKSKLADASRLLTRAPYDAEPLRAAIYDTIGEDAANRSMRDHPAALLIVAVNNTTGAPSIFASGGLAGRHAAPVALVDAIMASAAAPSFFPVKKIGTDDYIDGGLIANAPDLVAYGEACRRLAITPENLYMLSIGTAGRRRGAAPRRGEQRPGAVSWVAGKRLVQTIMAAQEALAVRETGAFLGDRYLHIDQSPLKKQEAAIADLDQADDDATQTLLSLAQRSWTKWSEDRRLRDFFE